ncbi:molybdenum cofactor guanylyltransferase [Listeria sp. FSL L7-1485]|uniref:Molybdenum cofactor guanylyltransferase n=1 Tax=Listeria immobilis TaxID=2713502 RepID=A0A7X1C9H1_9LIST|nr:molybdenum cofactor guanylyltransferase [Listeria immobilis]MBC1489301.1 molybdenum cofactor guanylyltransferase [Listeria immobilis]MBC1536722.1 molybdenum cofactor guanylyltransferase [Listeria immobilis]
MDKSKNEKVNVGIILAGGKSSRFGESKTFFRDKASGKTWIELTVDKLTPFCEMIFISANSTNYMELTKLFQTSSTIRIIPDIPAYSDYGPLGGIYAVTLAANQYTHTNFLILPTDMPFLTTKEIAHLEANPNSYAQTNQANHYLVANIPYSLPALTEILHNKEHRVIKLLQKLHSRPLFFENEHPFRNINFPDDLN